MLAAIVNVSHLIEVAGYPLLFLVVMSEASGVPVPGETALITGAVLASQGKLQIEIVIAVAAVAAIVGDNLGYLIGRKGGRWLLERPGIFHRQRLEVLRVGEPFFRLHGPKAVFFGRFLLGLRVWASWLAGAPPMPWGPFGIGKAHALTPVTPTFRIPSFFFNDTATTEIYTLSLHDALPILFFGRFLLGLRVWASWLAGATRMPWRSFVLWNALGGITWAIAIGLIGYFLGHSAGNAIETFGLFGLAAVLLAITSGLVLHRRHRRGHPLGEQADAREDTAGQPPGPPLKDSGPVGE